MTTLWDTTGSEVVRALLAERRTGGALASGLALSVVAVVDEKHVPEAEEALTKAATAHPCRLLIVVRRALDTDDRLDAEISIGGRFGPTEAIVLRMYGRLTLHAESVVLPLLAADAPIVTWWHAAPPDEIATDALGVLANRRITDCARAADSIAALTQRAVDFAPGDTDLAWTRTTGWRALLASAFDSVAGTVTGIQVTGEQGNPSAALLAGWLSQRLGCGAERADSSGPGITETTLQVTTDDGNDVEIRISRPDGRMATLSRSGHPDRTLPLLRRDLGDLLGEELRRLDTDAAYALALETATGTARLADRSPLRRHKWRDPAKEAASA